MGQREDTGEDGGSEEFESCLLTARDQEIVTGAVVLLDKIIRSSVASAAQIASVFDADSFCPSGEFVALRTMHNALQCGLDRKARLDDSSGQIKRPVHSFLIKARRKASRVIRAIFFYDLEIRDPAGWRLWPATRKPTPEDCLREAQRIRQSYNAPEPTTEAEKRRIKLIEEIAKVADLSSYYKDDYRQLSLTVHSNQAGILNAGSGFLVRKGMIALCNAALLASATLCKAFRLRKQFNDELQDHEARIAELMQKPDLLPPSGQFLGHPPVSESLG